MTTIIETYVNFVTKIYNQGLDTFKDDSQIREIVGHHIYIDDPLGLGYKAKYANITPKIFLENILQGKYDVESSPVKNMTLYEYVSGFDDGELHDFEYTYPNRILEYFDINQFNTCKERLKQNLNTNRAVMTIYDPKMDSHKKDIPCLQFIQFIIRGHELTIHCMFRSNDIFGAFYSNMFLITYIGLRMTESLNKETLSGPILFNGIHYYSTSAHIYKTDFNAIKKMIKKEKNIWEKTIKHKYKT